MYLSATHGLKKESIHGEVRQRKRNRFHDGQRRPGVERPQCAVGGNLVAHVRMDGAWIGSIDISIKKAFPSRAFDIATKDLATQSQSGGQFFRIHASNDGRVMIFAGGVPLKRDGKIVGAIGVSGGSGEQDHAVAEAGGYKDFDKGAAKKFVIDPHDSLKKAA